MKRQMDGVDKTSKEWGNFGNGPLGFWLEQNLLDRHSLVGYCPSKHSFGGAPHTASADLNSSPAANGCSSTCRTPSIDGDVEAVVEAGGELSTAG